MDVIFGILGVTGAGLCTLMFFLLQAEKVDSQSLVFYVPNLIGGLLIFVSVLANFDPGDLGSIVMEGCWMVISVMGILKAMTKTKEKAS